MHVQEVVNHSKATGRRVYAASSSLKLREESGKTASEYELVPNEVHYGAN
jgi:hypothetical protein